MRSWHVELLSSLLPLQCWGCRQLSSVQLPMKLGGCMAVMAPTLAGGRWPHRKERKTASLTSSAASRLPAPDCTAARASLSSLSYTMSHVMHHATSSIRHGHVLAITPPGRPSSPELSRQTGEGSQCGTTSWELHAPLVTSRICTATPPSSPAPAHHVVVML